MTVRLFDRLRRGVPAVAMMTALVWAGTLAGVPGAAAATAGTISTIAGGAGGPAEATTVDLGDKYPVDGPRGVVFADGNLYVAGPGAVRQVTEVTDWLTTPAGTGLVAGPLGDKGPAAAAEVDPYGVTADRHGNLVVADKFNERVRVIAESSGTFYGKAMTSGDIYTIAGNGIQGYSGNGGPATNAELSWPQGVTVDSAGNVLIADGNNARVRVLAAKTGTFYGRAMTAGDIYKIAGNGSYGSFSNGTRATSAPIGEVYGVGVDGAGNALIATGGNLILVVAAKTGTFYGRAMTAGDIYKVAGDGTGGFSGDGGPATKAELDVPNGVTVDSAGNLLIADTQNSRIRVVAAKTGTFYGQQMTAHDIYTIAGDATRGFSGDGGPANAAELSWPGGVSVDGSGNLVIADTSNQRVRVVAESSGTFYGRVMAAGEIYTVAGDGTFGKASGNGSLATSAQLSGPSGVAADGTGTIISDTADNQVRLVAASTGTFYGQAMTAGNIYALAGNGIAQYSGDGRPGTAAELDVPAGVAADAAGNVLIADSSNNRVRVVAAATGTFYGQAMTAGDIYTIAGGGGTFGGFSGDGGPATKAELNHPVDVAVDAAGNIVIADEYNDRIRVVAAATGTFYGQAMTAGDIYTIAGNGSYGYSGDGGPATSAALRQPQGLAVDGAGNVLVADTSNYRIRVVAATTGTFYGQAMTAGGIYTIAGNGTAGFSGDSSPAANAELNNPVGVAADAAGNVVIADSSNNRVRMVATTTGTFYGQAMTAGDIYTIAGNGTAGFSGDSSPASNGEVCGPVAVTVTNAGTLLIADEGNNRVRAVTG